ncbi:MAG TPA: DUF427 domain-containing protein [Gammaproteobacteria bacterium]|nr:DUF427 domain-containing protein [Gammaproteobacteria bacterium]HIL95930.1 DUF427 domain-containing protein [Pseudomonadales bacterium]
MDVSEEILRARRKWKFDGSSRPTFAITPTANQESVWDYPRPPCIEAVKHVIEVRHQGRTIALSARSTRVLETAGAPTYYFPPADIDPDLKPADSTAICEWKGLAQSMTLAGREVGWRYVKMFPEFLELHLWASFYPAKLDCYVNDQPVKPQPGGYYGGWITNNLVGPVKGSPGSQDW